MAFQAAIRAASHWPLPPSAREAHQEAPQDVEAQISSDTPQHKPSQLVAAQVPRTHVGGNLEQRVAALHLVCPAVAGLGHLHTCRRDGGQSQVDISSA